MRNNRGLELKSEKEPLEAELRYNFKDQRIPALIAALAIATAGGILAINAHASNSVSQRNYEVQQFNSKVHLDRFLNQLGNSLINLHDENQGGWRFKSEIQAPHYQTDRDVGAASVGMGFLAMASANPHDKRWLEGAKQTAQWLEAVSSQDNHGGRYWHDYVDNHETSSDVYTSFDDGTIGIGDFFWQLYEKTNDPQYKKIALQTLAWTFSQAESFKENGIQGYRWKWDITQKDSPYYMGMGEGSVGIITNLATYYERLRTSDPQIAGQCKKYIDGGLKGIDAVQKELGNNIGVSLTIPETGVTGQDGDTTLNSGYLSGAAGEVYMYLKLHQALKDKKYLDRANDILGWLGNDKHGPMVRLGHNSVAWKLSLDPQGGNDNHFATGFEEGIAGIGWTYLQAYQRSGNKAYLQVAQAAGNRLLDVAIKTPDGGLAWYEDEHPIKRQIHANLNNGIAGIGIFLRDLFLRTGDKKYQTGSQGALRRLMASARYHGQNIYWNDNGGSEAYSNDPSWHWGLAGIIEFAQRMRADSKQDIPGEQPALPRGNWH